ncbi:YhgE/Pip family protein [Nonomuraea sp. NPDC050556]|uniref:YhgE/Pip family protein n=1 Tax=Nonomuraea sp. NPDC050556 TaxID=3364369 RepID=UPI0037BAA10E
MSPALGLGRFELRRFARSRLTRAAIVAIVLIPLLYAGLYLWAFWDPQDNLSRLPAALVMLDEGSQGQELADELIDRKIFDWHEVSPEEANLGVEEGRYYVSLTIPADFTQKVESPKDKDGTPEPAYLDVHIDQGRSYLIETIAKAVFAEVQASAAHSAVSKYLDSIFVAFSKLHDSTGEAADGAGKLADGSSKAYGGAGQLVNGLSSAQTGTKTLHDGLGTASKGAGALATGLGTAKQGTGALVNGANALQQGAGKLLTGLITAKQGSGKLAAGLGTAGKGVRKLADGAAQLDKGAAQLAAGNAEVYSQVHRLSGVVNSVADVAVPFLNKNSKDIQRMALFVADAAGFLADCLEDLPNRVHAARLRADKAYQELKAYMDAHPELDPALKALLKAAVDAAKRLSELADWVDAFVGEHLGELKDFERRALEVARLARLLAAEAPTLGKKLEEARDKFNQLDTGLGKLAAGAAKLHKGTGQAVAGVIKLGEGVAKLEDGAVKLDGGLGKLATGAGTLDKGIGTLVGGVTKLDNGVGKLVTGADQLDAGLIKLTAGAGELDAGLAKLYGGAVQLQGGLGELDKGANKLADALRDGQDQIPDYDATERSERADMMSDPIRVNTRIDDPVPNYGTGFAPYFLPLSLWVGAMITYMLLRPLNPRVVASATPSWRAALAGWLPAAGLGVLQVGAISAVLKWGLGLHVQNWPGMLALLALASAAFMALVQAANALLGPVGKVVALAVLMLQLTSAGGTYPVETSAEFFQAISKWLPMSWVVSALRRLISGGYVVPVYQAAGVLVLFLALGLVCSTIAARKRRMWSVTRLHPVLSL